MEDFTSKTN